MTNFEEAKCVRARSRDRLFDGGGDRSRLLNEEHADVSVEMVIENLHANADATSRLSLEVLPHIPKEASRPEHRALDTAILTDRKLRPS